MSDTVALAIIAVFSIAVTGALSIWRTELARREAEHARKEAEKAVGKAAVIETKTDGVHILVNSQKESLEAKILDFKNEVLRLEAKVASLEAIIVQLRKA